MGRLSTQGFSETETSKIHENWGLKTGEIFDAGYADEFSKKGLFDIMRVKLLERGAQGKPAPNIKWEYKPDRKTLTVDVTLALTN
jgi:hypothetical protein